MSVLNINGPFIQISFNPNELSDNDITIPLEAGYSYKRIFINRVTNISALFFEY